MARIQVKVTPRSSRCRVEWVDGMLRVWVHAAPTDGQANEAVCRAIADALDKPSSAVTVATGLKSRTKTIEVSELTDEEIRTKLA